MDEPLHAYPHLEGNAPLTTMGLPSLYLLTTHIVLRSPNSSFFLQEAQALSISIIWLSCNPNSIQMDGMMEIEPIEYWKLDLSSFLNDKSVFPIFDGLF